MQSFDNWKDKTLAVPSLLLDSQNPRIPDTDSKQGQRELIADLVENDKVYELAKSIVDKRRAGHGGAGRDSGPSGFRQELAGP